MAARELGRSLDRLRHRLGPSAEWRTGTPRRDNPRLARPGAFPPSRSALLSPSMRTRFCRCANSFAGLTEAIVRINIRLRWHSAKSSSIARRSARAVKRKTATSSGRARKDAPDRVSGEPGSSRHTLWRRPDTPLGLVVLRYFDQFGWDFDPRSVVLRSVSPGKNA